MNKQNTLSLLKFFLGWPLSLIALFFLWRLFANKLPQILPHLANINYLYVIISLLCFISYFLIRAYIWQQLLAYRKHTVQFKKSLFMWSISEVKRYIPGNIWSFLGRVHLFGQENVPNGIIGQTLVVEMLLIILSSAIVSLCSLPLVFKLIHIPISFTIFELSIVLFIFICSLAFCFAKGLPRKISELLRNYKINDRVFLLFLYSIAFVIFGVGTYFAILAIHMLPLEKFAILSGFFTFSLLAGYVSFITPTGLGVREAIITTGLALLMPVEFAAFAAIFSRVLLILGEVLFLAFSFAWNNVRSNQVTKIEQHISHYRYAYIVGILTTLYIAYYTAASIYRYINFNTGRFDLGNMDQVVWNSLHGRIFETTDPNGTNIVSRLAFHADFILLLLVPFYAVWSSPQMLLIIQTVVLGVGGVFVYLLAKSILQNKPLSLTLAFTYFINPAVGYVNLYDFHPVSLAITFLLAMWYFLLKKKYLWMFVFLLLACLTKEEIWAIGGFIGLYLFFVHKKKVLGVLTTAIGFFLFYFLISFIIPKVKGSEHFALSYYSDFGTSPASIIRTIIFSPIKTIAILNSKAQLSYLWQLLLPLSFLPVVGLPFLFFAMPDLGIDLLSNQPGMHQIYYQYSAGITPFLFIAAIYGCFWVMKKLPQIPYALLITILIACSLYGEYTIGPLPGSKEIHADMFTKPIKNITVVNDFVNNIPTRYSIAATNNLGSHLSHRQKIYTIPVGIDKADVIMFLLNDPFAQPSLAGQRQMVQEMKSDKRYTEVYELDDFIVFEKTGVNLKRLPQNKFRNILPILRKPRQFATPTQTE